MIVLQLGLRSPLGVPVQLFLAVGIVTLVTEGAMLPTLMESAQLCLVAMRQHFRRRLLCLRFCFGPLSRGLEPYVDSGRLNRRHALILASALRSGSPR